MVLAAAWRMRLHRVRREFALLWAERNRVSREIHDTLLQGLVGIAVQCKVISDLMETAPDSAKELLERVRGQANHSIRDTTESILAMRSSAVEREGLIKALRESGEDLTAGTRTHFRFEVSGHPERRALHVEQELFRIGREAISNAVRHSQATELSVQLCYNRGWPGRLRIRDNGCGFDVDLVASSFGIKSMRARAERIGATVTFTSHQGSGTEVDVVVRAA
jgi:signal transduction histidine kinase